MRIKQLLSESCMSAKEFASKCDMSEMGMSNILTNKSQPNAKTIIKMAKVLGVTCGELFDDYTTESEPHSVIIDGIEYVPKRKTDESKVDSEER